MVLASAAAVAANAVASTKEFLSGNYHPPSGLLNAIESPSIDGGVPINPQALTIALDVVQAYAVLLTLLFTITIFIFVAFCICSRKDDGYDEFELGGRGITTVRICHDGGENGVSIIPQLNGSGTLASQRATEETSEASSRFTGKRELPAIPDQDRKSGRPSSQTGEHYTDPITGASNLKLIGGVQVLPAGAIGPGGRAAVVKEIKKDDKKLKKEKSSDAPAKAHQYSQVTKPEHAYAKVIERPDEGKSKAVIIEDKSRSIVTESRYTSATKTEKRLEESKPMDKFTKPKSVSSSTEASGVSTSQEASRPLISPDSNIPAALAISGRQRANEEMPYMTPSILQPSTDMQQNQQHFSGDSQDSRGYTSISVREPLAALKARQAAEGGGAAAPNNKILNLRNGNGPEGEGYYMTVSDDSADETYACIYEGGSRGTGGSATYAQIEPRTPVSSSMTQQQATNQSNQGGPPPAVPAPVGSQEQSPPAPPSVDSLRHVVHSRQASASSATSTGMGSPVAEKRGTRSPLPPLPQGDASLYATAESPTGSTPSSQNIPKSPPKATSQFVDKNAPRSLEEMYAKVNKKSHSRGNSAGGESESGSITTSRRGSSDVTSGPRGGPSATSPLDMTHSLVEGGPKLSNLPPASRAKSCEVSSWSTGIMNTSISSAKDRTSGNYESIPSQSLYSGSSDPGYETVKNGDPPYASVETAQSYVGYETVRGSDVESEEPGYETLKHKEPGYESVATSEDPGYESVQSNKGKDYDPGYEELSHPRTNSETDPNYEQLKFNTEHSSTVEHCYEEVKKQESNYELVSNFETVEKLPAEDSSTVPPPPVFDEGKKDASSEAPLYASIIKKDKRESDSFKLTDSSLKSDKSESNKSSSTANKRDTLVDIDDLLQTDSSSATKVEDLLGGTISSTQPESPGDLDHFLSGIGGTGSAPRPVSGDSREFSLTQEMVTIPDDTRPVSTTADISLSYPVVDSPEDVELPPHEENDSSNRLQQERLIDALSKQKSEEEAAVALTFTAASPIERSPKSSEDSSSSSAKDESSQKEAKEEMMAAPPPPQFDENGAEEEQSPLPPPLIPNSSADEGSSDVIISPPPPPPPNLEEFSIQDFSPPPPPANINGLDDSQDILPPPSQDESMNVTINPMAVLEQHAGEQPPLPPPSESSPLCGGGSSSLENSTTVNGSIVDSLVTVDARTGSDPSSTVIDSSSTPTLQHSSSTSSSDSKQSIGAAPPPSSGENAVDEITPV